MGGGGQVVAECGGGDEMRGSEEAECLAASDACVCVCILIKIFVNS